MVESFGFLGGKNVLQIVFVYVRFCGIVKKRRLVGFRANTSVSFGAAAKKRAIRWVWDKYLEPQFRFFFRSQKVSRSLPSPGKRAHHPPYCKSGEEKRGG